MSIARPRAPLGPRLPVADAPWHQHRGLRQDSPSPSREGPTLKDDCISSIFAGIPFRVGPIEIVTTAAIVPPVRAATGRFETGVKTAVNRSSNEMRLIDEARCRDGHLEAM